MKQLENQIAVVTGAGRGIGRAIALKFAAEGADVVCVSRTQENSEKVAAEIRALGRKAWAFAVDVADAAAVSAAAGKILAEAGKVDILVNNAGVTRDGLLMRMSDADWDTVLDTNLKGAFLVTKAFSRAMIKARAGRIISVSSVIGLIGNAGQCMTSELKPEMREAILKQIPLGSFGSAEDIAGAALFLAGPSARYVTGQVLTVDGGMVM
jgi:3-oxoacyl-[acyl-carrier protein] reductase